MRKTALYEKHCAHHAKLVEFSGWQMPLYYSGIIQEHEAVRKCVGLTDVSHMGFISISGKDSESFLDYLSTNTITSMKNSSSMYTVWCHESGVSLDDLIIYRISQYEFFLITNAVNRRRDLDHLKLYANNFEVSIKERYDEIGILAVQGPSSIPLIQEIFPETKTVLPRHFLQSSFDGEKILLSSTGYTGESGFELFIANKKIEFLWETIINLGKKYSLSLVGLGARDTLRLEMGYALYGHELTDKICPNESVSYWTVKFQKKDFLGKEALLNLERSSRKRHQYGIVLKESGIARQGYEVFYNSLKVGIVTSGGYSPSLKSAIAIIMVDKPMAKEEIVQVKIRENRVQAEVVSLPFYQRKSKEV